jgi:peptidoglycan hydrolase-like protein with peptidoglycan-binding domain
MRGKLAMVVGTLSFLSAGALLAQQAPTKPATKPAATQAAPQATQATQQAKPAAHPAAAPKWSTDQIKEAQEGLKRAKAYTGPVNGVLGPSTRRAIRSFQKAHQMKQTGALSDSLLTALKAVP